MSAGDAKYALTRGSREATIWPFSSPEDAEDWALEHGCLDWKVERLAEQPEHQAVCGRCREVWPCEHVRLDRQASAIIQAGANACARCGKRVGWMEVRVKGGGLLGEDIKFHGRKGACRNEGLRRLGALGTPEAQAEIARLDREAENVASHRAWIERDKQKRRSALMALLGSDPSRPASSPGDEPEAVGP